MDNVAKLRIDYMGGNLYFLLYYNMVRYIFKIVAEMLLPKSRLTHNP